MQNDVGVLKDLRFVLLCSFVTVVDHKPNAIKLI